MISKEKDRCGTVIILGAPNAGKSTLLNALVGEKISIVTHKVQTTRTHIRGAFIINTAQVILVDTPGVFSPKRYTDQLLVESAWQTIDTADLIVLLVDVMRGLSKTERHILDTLEKIKKPVVLVLNKIDQMSQKTDLLPLVEQYEKSFPFQDIFMISALKKTEVERLKHYLADQMPVHPWIFEADQVTDAPLRFMAAELTREKTLLWLHQEIPYDLWVETEEWNERPDGSVEIGQVISIKRANQRKIILGEKGQTIKKIGMLARKEMEEIFERTVHLKLFVKVAKDWKKVRESNPLA